MTYRSRPVFCRPESWALIAVVALVLAVLNGAMFAYSLIYGTPSPLNLIVAVAFALSAIGSLFKAHRLAGEDWK